jgi:hypothetical protein
VVRVEKFRHPTKVLDKFETMSIDLSSKEDYCHPSSEETIWLDDKLYWQEEIDAESGTKVFVEKSEIEISIATQPSSLMNQIVTTTSEDQPLKRLKDVNYTSIGPNLLKFDKVIQTDGGNNNINVIEKEVQTEVLNPPKRNAARIAAEFKVQSVFEYQKDFEIMHRSRICKSCIYQKLIECDEGEFNQILEMANTDQYRNLKLKFHAWLVNAGFGGYSKLKNFDEAYCVFANKL